METMGRPGNPNDRQHLQNRVNQSKYRQNGKIFLIAMGCAVLVTTLTTSSALAQSATESEVTLGSEVTPDNAKAIDAAVGAMPQASTNVLDALSDSTRAKVERICLPVQYQSGVIAYRECISEH